MNKNQLKITAATITLIISIALVLVAKNYFQSFVWLALGFLPLLIGFLPTYIAGKIPMTKQEGYKLSFVTLGFIVLILLPYFIESGLLSALVVIIPLVSPIVWLFSYLAFRINNRNRKQAIINNNKWVEQLSVAITLSLVGFCITGGNVS